MGEYTVLQAYPHMLTVAVEWRNYGPIEKQIQLRTTAQRKAGRRDPTLNRRLAKAICKAVQNAMAVSK